MKTNTALTLAALLILFASVGAMSSPSIAGKRADQSSIARTADPPTLPPPMPVHSA